MTSTWGGGDNLTLVKDPEVQCAYCYMGVPFSQTKDLQIRHNTTTLSWQLLGLTCASCREYLGKRYIRRKQGDPSSVGLWNGQKFEKMSRASFDELRKAK